MTQRDNTEERLGREEYEKEKNRRRRTRSL
jgi:hypothetical protein